MQNKPDKYGLKFWTLVEVFSKYIVIQSRYLGKDPSGAITKNLGTKVVIDLVETASLGTGYNITGDNFFSSLKLVDDLRRKGITYVGTIRNNRLEICEKMKSKKPLHESEFFFTADHTATGRPSCIVSYQCKKNRSVLLISSLHLSKRIDDTEKKRPEIVSYYNSNKCGVDVVDQMTRLYSTKTPSRRWPMAVWCNMLDLAGINSWIIFKKVTGSKISRRNFLFQLISELIMNDDMHVNHEGSSSVSIQGLPKEVLRKRKHCSMVDCKNMTSTLCSFCDMAVCGACAIESAKFTLMKCKRHE